MPDDKSEEGRGDDQKSEDGRGGGSNGSADLVNEIVTRAAALGGWLVVSMIAPIPASGRRFARGNTSAIERAARKSMTFEATERTKAANARAVPPSAPRVTPPK